MRSRCFSCCASANLSGFKCYLFPLWVLLIRSKANTFALLQNEELTNASLL